MTAYHVRNPVRWHGQKSSERFTQLPNELVRDGDLSSDAYRLACVIRSHREGFQISQKSLGDMFKWDRKKVRTALLDLTNSRWLAVTKYKTHSGARAYEEYHVGASRKFTEAEAVKLNATVILPTAAQDSVDGERIPTPVGDVSPPTWGADPHTPGEHVPTKEHQPEHQEEDQTRTPARECYGCSVWGESGCSIHAQPRELVSVGADEPNWGPSPSMADDDECPF